MQSVLVAEAYHLTESKLEYNKLWHDIDGSDNNSLLKWKVRSFENAYNTFSLMYCDNLLAN